VKKKNRNQNLNDLGGIEDRSDDDRKNQSKNRNNRSHRDRLDNKDNRRDRIGDIDKLDENKPRDENRRLNDTDKISPSKKNRDDTGDSNRNRSNQNRRGDRLEGKIDRDLDNKDIRGDSLQGKDNERGSERNISNQNLKGNRTENKEERVGDGIKKQNTEEEYRLADINKPGTIRKSYIYSMPLSKNLNTNTFRRYTDMLDYMTTTGEKDDPENQIDNNNKNKEDLLEDFDEDMALDEESNTLMDKFNSVMKESFESDDLSRNRFPEMDNVTEEHEEIISDEMESLLNRIDQIGKYTKNLANQSTLDVPESKKEKKKKVWKGYVFIL